MNRRLRFWLVILAASLLALAVVPLVVPLPALEGTRRAEDLADPDSRFAEVNGLRVHYKLAGSGEPSLVLLHGFLASTFSWREVIGPLGERGRVVAFDRPAFGLTSRPMPGSWVGASPYSAGYSQDLTLALMDLLEMEQAVLIGHSAGGTLAVQLALEHPERVRALVLLDAAIYTGGGAASWLRPILATPQLRRIGPVLLRSVRDWGVEFGRSAWHDPSRLTEEIWAGYTLPLQVDDWDRALYEFTLAGSAAGLDDRLDQLDLPVLVITGDDDRIVPTSDSLRLADEIPHAALAVLPGCGHVPHEECPAAFLAAVEDFLAGLP